MGQFLKYCKTLKNKLFSLFLSFLVQLEATWSQLEAHLVAKKLHVAGLAGLVRLVGLARLAGLAGLAGQGSQDQEYPQSGW